MATKGEILLVDDDPDIRDSLRIILEKNGYSVRTAANGDEALAALKAKRPALMILDVMMTTEGTEISTVVVWKKVETAAPMPVIYIWWAQTMTERKPSTSTE